MIAVERLNHYVLNVPAEQSTTLVAAAVPTAGDKDGEGDDDDGLSGGGEAGPAPASRELDDAEEWPTAGAIEFRSFAMACVSVHR